MSCDESMADRSCALDTEAIVSGTNDFTGPIDDVLALVQNAFDKRIKISAKYMQFVDKQIHEMKNRIVNHLLSIENKKTPWPCNASKFNANENLLTLSDEKEWPSLKVMNRGKSRSSIIVKPNTDKNVKVTDVNTVESKVNKMLSSENIDATILSSSTTKAGDVVIKFNEGDDVQNIARKMENNFGYKTQGRTMLLPKITISHVPKYISLSTRIP